MTKKLKGFVLALAILLLPALIVWTGALALAVPEAGPGIFIGSTYMGAMAVAAGATGPAGWAIFGLITLWGA